MYINISILFQQVLIKLLVSMYMFFQEHPT